MDHNKDNPRPKKVHVPTREDRLKQKKKVELAVVERLLDLEFFPFTVKALRDRGYRVVVKHQRLDREDVSRTLVANDVRTRLASLMREVHSLLDNKFESLENVKCAEFEEESFNYLPRHLIKQGEIHSCGGLTKILITKDDDEWTGLSVCNISDNYCNRLGLNTAMARAIGGDLNRFCKELGVTLTTEAETYITDLYENSTLVLSEDIVGNGGLE